MQRQASCYNIPCRNPAPLAMLLQVELWRVQLPLLCGRAGHYDGVILAVVLTSPAGPAKDRPSGQPSAP